MLLAVSGSRVALGSPVRVSQGIKDSSTTLKYYKRNITYLGLKKKKKGGREPKGRKKKQRIETEDSRGRDHTEAWRLILQLSV